MKYIDLLSNHEPLASSLPSILLSLFLPFCVILSLAALFPAFNETASAIEIAVMINCWISLHLVAFSLINCVFIPLSFVAGLPPLLLLNAPQMRQRKKTVKASQIITEMMTKSTSLTAEAKISTA